MNLINKEVTHERFGKGSVTKLNGSIIEIDFTSEHKKFIFPDAFGKHLKLQDRNAANSLKKVIENKQIEMKQEEQKKEEEKELQRRKLQLKLEHEKLMRNYKLHPESQLVFWCDSEEQRSVFNEWKVFSGVIKSGEHKGKPKKVSRMHPNSACLLTVRDSSMQEKDRRIIGVYMVREDFVGKLSETGYIPAHSEYKLQLTEQESSQMPFWKYYVNERTPDKMSWKTGKHRYFDNLWLAQILLDIVNLKSDPKEREQAQQFLQHFCKMNQLDEKDIPKPNGVLG